MKKTTLLSTKLMLRKNAIIYKQKKYKNIIQFNILIFKKNCFRNLLSQVQNVSKEKTTPTFVICKPEEDDETVLLGSYIENNCFTTTKINDNGWIGISQIESKIDSDYEKCHRRVQGSDKVNIIF